MGTASAWSRAEIGAAVGEALKAVAPESDPASLDPDSPFRDQLDIDSVDFLNFVLGVEKRLGVRVPETDYPQLSTLAGCLAYLETFGAAR